MFTSIPRVLTILLAATTYHVSYGADHSKIFYLLNKASYTELNFRMEQELIIIPLTVNGSENMNFILDTGTESPVILNRKYIKNLDLPLGRHIDFQGAGKKKTTRGQVINSMQIQIADAYTDHIGGDQYNLRLSLRRASSVVEFYTENGISEDRIESRGLGKAPVECYDETEELGCERNRRAESHPLSTLQYAPEN